MSRIISFEVENEKDYKLLKMLTERIGIHSTELPAKSNKKKALKKPNGNAMAAILEKIAIGGNMNSIKNPREWQRKTRTDRKLPNRQPMLLDSNIIIYSSQPAHKELRTFIRQNNPFLCWINYVEVLGYNKLTTEDKIYFESLFK